MRPLLVLLVFSTLAIAVPRSAHAAHTTVPDQYPTIQAAINAMVDFDTVYVRDGDYPEALTLSKPLYLVAVTKTVNYQLKLGVPRVRSLTWLDAMSPRVIRGFRFSELVAVSGTGSPEFESCWFGGGLNLNTYSSGHLWSCIVFGNITVNPGSIDIAMSTVIGGTITYNPPGDDAIHDNVVVGPATTGIVVWSDASAVRNYVRGCTNGIESYSEYSGAWDNIVEDCPGIGIKGSYSGTSYPISGNVVRRCGRGMDLVQSAVRAMSVTNNAVENSTAEGVVASGGTGGTLSGNTVSVAGGLGIDAGSSFTTVSNNRVVHAGGAGLVASGTGGLPVRVTGNVIGHAAGAGLVVSGPMTVRNNTSSMNAGAGFSLTGTSADSIDHDIAYLNGGAGLVWSGAAPVMGCNDWFGNTGGTTSGVAMAPTDVVLNPLFCNPASDDVGLQAVSPLASYPGCGLIGALGVACSNAGAPAPEPVANLDLVVGPSPSRGAVRFAWASPGGGATLEVFDVTGQRRWTRVLEGVRGEVLWRGEGARGTALPPGVYFSRVTSASGATFTRRIVLTP